ncbi:unnamed protein product [Notodromas monacha]|uniref:Importin N-terminal domain-containing protein n=1 Tax=Notodromas monacha TaxID=399045 RepID=A0A7R9G9P7_9CRUS|nr:unnamed protein product [Notodromas monacha]CAG0913133.1 unnamed protein product [Notodromas monacha]
MEQELIGILEKTLSPDQNELKAATEFLEQAAKADLVAFLRTLSDILKARAANPIVRVAAGLQLKNQIAWKDPAKKDIFTQKWFAIPEEARQIIKTNVLEALGTEGQRPSTAAQCVAHIAIIELPRGVWPRLIPDLVDNVCKEGVPDSLKAACLESIGYICQDIQPAVLAEVSNSILTAIVNGMRLPDENIRLAAVNALLNSLEFTQNNFAVESERNVIMTVTCEATTSNNTQVRVVALQCLVRIISLYYEYMEVYMASALLPITLEAMNSDTSELVLQGIEFWSTVCETELDLAINASEAAELERPALADQSRYYAKGALKYVLPIVLETLTKQDECDEDEWTPAKGAGVCLSLFAECTEDAIVEYVVPFVTQNIGNGDWRYREAAVMAFGSILEGPSNEKLKPMMDEALPVLMNLMSDTSIQVRDTTAWTLGRICEYSDVTSNSEVLTALLNAFCVSLSDEPSVAANVCWALKSLSFAAYMAVQTSDEESIEPDAYPLSPFFHVLMQKLLWTTERADGAQSNLRGSAYEAIMDLASHSAKDCHVAVQETMLVILDRLRQVLSLGGQVDTQPDHQQVVDVQANLCAALQVILRKLQPDEIDTIGDAVMTALLQLLSTTRSHRGVQEDAIMAVASFIDVSSAKFTKYIEAFVPFLLLGLQAVNSPQVNSVSVGIVGDLCRAVGDKVQPYADALMTELLKNLASQEVHRNVKPQIFSVFGDMALALGVRFSNYLQAVFTVLHQASMAQIEGTDPEMREYLNALRIGCLETYSGLVQGMKGENNNVGVHSGEGNPLMELGNTILPPLSEFLKIIALDLGVSDECVCTALGLMGDISSSFGAPALPVLETHPIPLLLQRGKTSKSKKTRTMTSWVMKSMKKAKTTATSNGV